MTDMVFFKDSSVHVLYNKYSANGASETNLCKQGYDSKHLVDNRIFAPFTDLGKDTYVSIWDDKMIIIFIEYWEISYVLW